MRCRHLCLKTTKVIEKKFGKFISAYHVAVAGAVYYPSAEVTELFAQAADVSVHNPLVAPFFVGPYAPVDFGAAHKVVHVAQEHVQDGVFCF